jgi:hypothetical protein
MAEVLTARQCPLTSFDIYNLFSYSCSSTLVLEVGLLDKLKETKDNQKQNTVQKVDFVGTTTIPTETQKNIVKKES